MPLSKRVIAPIVAGGLILGFTAASEQTVVGKPGSAADTAPSAAGAANGTTAADLPSTSCSGPGGASGDQGWTATSTRIAPSGSYHPYVANGYLGARVPPNGSGYTATGEKTGWPLFTPRYDGSFVSGLYAHNRHTTEDRQVAAAIPGWSGLEVATGGAHPQTFSSATAAGQVSHYRQTLHLRCGLVRTSLTWTAADGRRTDLTYDVIADRTHPHAAAVHLRLTPHWSGRATVTDVIDGRGARRIEQTGGGARPEAAPGTGPAMDVTFRADGTGTTGAVSSTLQPTSQLTALPSLREQRGEPARKLTNRQALSFPVHGGGSYELTKYVGVDTSLTSHDPRAAASAAARGAAAVGWQRMLNRHAAAWNALWRSDIEVAGHRDLQAWVRSAQYGLLANTRRGAANSISPVGLTSDNYAGEVFWDAETWMYPALLAAHPDLARTVVDYRYRTRRAAHANARRLGYDGLFYPWTSGSDGDLNSECHSWDPPHCRTQNHLMGDISLAAWQYYLATGDTTWLRDRGWPVMKGIAQFWASRVTRDDDGHYSIRDVAGPDEYSNGVDDGVFTNAGAATALRDAVRAAHVLHRPVPARWTTVADRLRIPYDAKSHVYQQYDGYQGSTIKQADTVLLMYPLNWPMTEQAEKATLDYYAAHTDPDGPAMTDSVHAVDAAALGEPGCATYTYLRRAIEPFVRGPFHEFSEARGDKAGADDPLAGSPAQDFLTGKGGFLQIFTGGLTGLRMQPDGVHLDPMLPPQLADGVTLHDLRWHGRTYDIALGAHHTTVRLTSGAPMRISTPHGARTVSRGHPATLETRRPDLAPTTDAARCRTTTATSQEPGSYATAAVDGNTATAWVPSPAPHRDSTAALTVDLGRAQRVRSVTPHWSGPAPASHTTQVSADGHHWRTVTGKGGGGPHSVRYVRVRLHEPGPARGSGKKAKDGGKPTGIAELTVRGT
ncbi:discoidin domain-containing protein [Streptomyces sp. NPDC059740]|uniref:discoidin domain-containing protein n=1 Tax=Streptomyces sp. NPDC059740 TaxID=3346926 RepID=UPI0036668D53